jgi:NAD(P)-dependent dehydrogenase (short-subunit alcohol dehydrogenase family)
MPEEVSYLPLDLADPEACEAAVWSVVDSAGRLDVLVNNAGTAVVAPLEETADTEAHRIFEVNVFGPMRLVRAALPVMHAQGGGRIVHVTSVNDIAPPPFSGWYSASKSAPASLSAVLDAELYGSGIFVTVIAPGFFRSAMAEQLPSFQVADDSRYATALLRLRASNAARAEAAGDPDEVARAIEDCIRADEPPARRVVGADGIALEETIRRTRPADLARLLRESVASLSR